MNITQTVSNRISRMKPGKLFSYHDLPEYSEHSVAVIKAISRIAKESGIVKVKKGLYYKAEQGSFGPMTPKESDVIRYFTSEKSKTVGYVTGPALYHRWGLSTQVPSEITVATSTNRRINIRLSGLRVTTVPARGKVTKDTAPLFQFLDALKDFDRIPDAESEVVIDKLGTRLSAYTRDEIEKIEKIAIRSYTPKTKALLGFLLSTFVDYNSLDLHKSLNPTTTFKVSISNTLKKNTEYWCLKSA